MGICWVMLQGLVAWHKLVNATSWAHQVAECKGVPAQQPSSNYFNSSVELVVKAYIAPDPVASTAG